MTSALDKCHSFICENTNETLKFLKKKSYIFSSIPFFIFKPRSFQLYRFKIEWYQPLKIYDMNSKILENLSLFLTIFFIVKSVSNFFSFSILISLDYAFSVIGWKVNPKFLNVNFLDSKEASISNFFKFFFQDAGKIARQSYTQSTKDLIRAIEFFPVQIHLKNQRKFFESDIGKKIFYYIFYYSFFTQAKLISLEIYIAEHLSKCCDSFILKQEIENCKNIFETAKCNIASLEKLRNT